MGARRRCAPADVSVGAAPADARSPPQERSMTGPLYALGRLAVRHRIVVVLAWLAVLVVLVALAHHTGEQTSDNLVLPGTDSQRATDVLTERFSDQSNGANPIALQVPAGHKLTDSRYKGAIDDVVTAYGKDPAVLKVVSPFASGGQLAGSKSIGAITLTLKDSAGDLTVDEAHAIIDVANPA